MEAEKERPIVLYVDDDDGNLTVFEASFLTHYEILTASGGEEALRILEKQAARQKPVQLLLTDQRMPGMTGVELLKITQDRYPDMVSIIVTAYSDINVVVSALNECKLYRYLNKPWEKDELALTLSGAYETYSLRLQNKILITELKEKVAELETLNKQLTSYTLNIVQKNEKIAAIKEDLHKFSVSYEENFKRLKDTLAEMNNTLKIDKDWEDFMLAFEKVHNNFFVSLKERFPDLSSGDLKICTFIKLKLSTKEISSIMGISPQSVNVARYRLRKKLGLHNEESLDDFLMMWLSPPTA